VATQVYMSTEYFCVRRYE